MPLFKRRSHSKKIQRVPIVSPSNSYTCELFYETRRGIIGESLKGIQKEKIPVSFDRLNMYKIPEKATYDDQQQE